ncbi:hypothetical protein YPPY101_1077, partial [Yersinia pestis PY-101]
MEGTDLKKNLQSE